MSNAALIVHQPEAKAVKTALEKHGLYDKTRKIIKHATKPNKLVIPTLMAFPITMEQLEEYAELTSSFDPEAIEIIELNEATFPIMNSTNHQRMEDIVLKWLRTLPLDVTAQHSFEDLYRHLPRSYSVYKPMLLLPDAALNSPAWKSLLSQVPYHETTGLYLALAQHAGVTHVARNAPIPPHVNSPDANTISENTVRSPVNIKPLYGDFGPSLPLSVPTQSDFESSLWVSTKQNGIGQVWAPMHTMFSRGNITEKSRILDLASSANGSYTAVDLYAGIGYFAFSYAKAGAAKVIGFEINGWSVEGMRRGAERNGWSIGIEKDQVFESSKSIQKNQITVFQMSNEAAVRVIDANRATLPRIAHVNCGLLPTSRNSWGMAVSIIDKDFGGYLHIHENFQDQEVDATAAEVLDEIQHLLWKTDKSKLNAKLSHIERVKSYAPGVIHCVLDISINPVS